MTLEHHAHQFKVAQTESKGMSSFASREAPVVTRNHTASDASNAEGVRVPVDHSVCVGQSLRYAKSGHAGGDISAAPCAQKSFWGPCNRSSERQLFELVARFERRAARKLHAGHVREALAGTREVKRFVQRSMRG